MLAKKSTLTVGHRKWSKNNNITLQLDTHCSLVCRIETFFSLLSLLYIRMHENRQFKQKELVQIGEDNVHSRSDFIIVEFKYKKENMKT